MSKIKSVLLICPLFTILLQGCYDCKKDYEKVVKPSLIDGIITGRDSLHNHGIPIIGIQNKDGSVESFGLDNSLTPLWYAIHINDSIYGKKQPGISNN